jgi:hypothetical protein
MITDPGIRGLNSGDSRTNEAQMGIRLEWKSHLRTCSRHHVLRRPHRIKIAPGESLLVKMRIKQNRHPDFGIFITDSYEILEVLKHIPREGDQTLMALRPGA